MNTPSQHYRDAERLADQAYHFTYGDGNDRAAGLALATEANARATLALAGVVGLLASAALLDGIDEPANEQEVALIDQANAWIEIAAGVANPEKPVTA